MDMWYAKGSRWGEEGCEISRDMRESWKQDKKKKEEAEGTFFKDGRVCLISCISYF